MKEARKLFVGPRVRRLREQSGWSQGALAQRLALSLSYVSQIENNQRPVTASVLLKLAEVFGGDVSQLHPRLVEAAAGKDVWVMGGGDLAGQFADRGLLDYVWIHQCPVVLGSGRPLLPRRLRLRRDHLARDGQLTAMLFQVVGPEP